MAEGRTPKKTAESKAAARVESSAGDAVPAKEVGKGRRGDGAPAGPEAAPGATPEAAPEASSGGDGAPEVEPGQASEARRGSVAQDSSRAHAEASGDLLVPGPAQGIVGRAESLRAGTAAPLDPPPPAPEAPSLTQPPRSNAVAVHAGLQSMGNQEHRDVVDADTGESVALDDIFDFGPDGNSSVAWVKRRVAEVYLPPGQKTPQRRLLFQKGVPVSRVRADQILHALRAERGEVEAPHGSVPVSNPPQGIRYPV